MNSIPSWWNEIEPTINHLIAGFSSQLRQKITDIKPHALIVKNPFLARARSREDARAFASWLIDSVISSSEETRFGDILEDAAIEMSRVAKGGRKSSTQGIDLEYDEGSTRSLVQIKSGTNWGNSSQHKKLASDFLAAQRVLRQGNSLSVRCIEGCCYGPSGISDRGTHIKIVGPMFWEEVTGWFDAGRKILEIVGSHATIDLHDSRNIAMEEVMNYLRRTGVANSDDEMNWNRLYDLISMSPRQRPK